MRIAFLLGSGLDNCGGTTLAQETENFLKKKATIFYMETKMFSSGSGLKERKNDSFVIFKSFKELYNKLKDNFDVLIILTGPAHKSKHYNDYTRMLKKLKIKKILFAIDRNKTMFTRGWVTKEILENVDGVITLVSPEHSCYKNILSLGAKNCFNADVNFFDYDREDYKSLNVPFKDKQKRISFVGRFANFKGYHHFIKAFGEGELPEGYVYTCEGGWFKWKDHKLSSTIGILAIICEDIKKKELKPHIKIYGDYTNYFNLEDTSKIHLFPSYLLEEMLPRLSLAEYLILPYRFNNYGKGSFKASLEYVMLESIALGTPIILTNKFGNEMEINNKPLIEQDCGLLFFENFSDIGVLVTEYNSNYDNNVRKMQEFFKDNYSNKMKWNKLKKIIKNI